MIGAREDICGESLGIGMIKDVDLGNLLQVWYVGLELDVFVMENLIIRVWKHQAL